MTFYFHCMASPTVSHIYLLILVLFKKQIMTVLLYVNLPYVL
jgi:hypothetical protein